MSDTEDDGSREPRNKISIAGVSKTYGPTRALDNVSLDVWPGTIHALVGGNGSGKSTLIKCLAGVVAADEGNFGIGDRSWPAARQTPELAKTEKLRFVHQQNTAFPEFTVAENLGIGGEFQRGFLGRIAWSKQAAHVRDVLERFDIPAEPGDRVETLGGAVQMLIAIARAMQDIEPGSGGLLVLDEPTASLPKQEVEHLLSALQGLAASGQSILMVTHRLAEIEQVCDEATVLRDGRVVSRLKRDELCHDTLVEAITGQVRAVVDNRRDRVIGEMVLRYEQDDDPSPLELRAGECVGVAGLLSSGRSSLLKRIFGSQPRGSDVLTLANCVRAPRTAAGAMRAGLAYVPEDRPAEGLFPEMDLVENTAIADLDQHRHYFRVRSRSERETARNLVERYGVKAPSVRSPIMSLSGGNQQKVIIARWMQRNPQVLLLDEPTQGIDIGARNEIHRLISEAVREGLAVLYLSSDFQELAEISDRIVIVKDGRVVDEIRDGEISEQRIYNHVFQNERSAL